MIGFIDLGQCTLVDSPTPPATPPPSNLQLFDIFDAEIPRHYYLAADSPHDKSEWLRELRRVLRDLRLQKLRSSGAPLPPVPPMKTATPAILPSGSVEEDKEMPNPKSVERAATLGAARAAGSTIGTPKTGRRKVISILFYFILFYFILFCFYFYSYFIYSYFLFFILCYLYLF